MSLTAKIERLIKDEEQKLEALKLVAERHKLRIKHYREMIQIAEKAVEESER